MAPWSLLSSYLLSSYLLPRLLPPASCLLPRVSSERPTGGVPPAIKGKASQLLFPPASCLLPPASYFLKNEN
ncbi:MAG: hypothetical protein F6K41_31290 [Symploca sp. SIO3E6]|nr:hypothetical protein [Caldora sp. SIO3E6]